MVATNFTGAVALAITMTAGVGVTAAAAQSMALPAEFPTSSYTASQYVDSKGCAFVRAGMDGTVTWVPRVDRARQQLCNFKPTETRTAKVAAAPAIPANVPIITVKEQPAPVTAPVTVRPAVAPAPQVAAVSRPAVPRVAPAPVRTVAAPVPMPAPTPRVVVVPAPKRITFAEACDGRFGVQPGFISARTRQPIDCGAAPQVTVASAPVPQAAPAPLRMTLADACAQQAETGQRFISAATGAPIVCAAPSAPVQIAQAPVVTPTETLASACGITGFTTDGQYPVRCGPQSQSPSGVQVARRAASPATASVSTRSTEVAALATGVPASNVIGATARTVRAPKGYAQVWTDGRINPQRGLAKPQVAVSVSTRSVAPAAVQAPAVAGGHRYVQVGSFGEPANAARLIARLQAAGLPVASAKSGGLKVIAAGPFRSAGDLQRALGIVRGMGFADSYTRS